MERQGSFCDGSFKRKRKVLSTGPCHTGPTESIRRRCLGASHEDNVTLRKGPEDMGRKSRLELALRNQWCPISGGRLKVEYAMPGGLNSMEALGKSKGLCLRNSSNGLVAEFLNNTPQQSSLLPSLL